VPSHDNASTPLIPTLGEGLRRWGTPPKPPAGKNPSHPLLPFLWKRESRCRADRVVPKSAADASMFSFTPPLWGKKKYGAEGHPQTPGSVPLHRHGRSSWGALHAPETPSSHRLDILPHIPEPIVPTPSPVSLLYQGLGAPVPEELGSSLIRRISRTPRLTYAPCLCSRSRSLSS